MKKKILTVMMLSGCGNSVGPSGSVEETYYPDGSIIELDAGTVNHVLKWNRFQGTDYTER